MRRGLHTFDMRGIESKQHRAILQAALNACDYPFIRIKRATKVRVPVTVTDTSRFVGDAPELHEAGHEQGFSPISDADSRSAALGLYWLPTREHPAGRIEVGLNAIGNPDLAREVMLAEVAHCIDYAVLSEQQRNSLGAAFRGTTGCTHSWFDGPEGYWGWHGENLMPAFLRAFAPSLPLPLEASQPWAHKVTAELAGRVREIMLGLA